MICHQLSQEITHYPNNIDGVSSFVVISEKEQETSGKRGRE